MADLWGADLWGWVRRRLHVGEGQGPGQECRERDTETGSGGDWLRRRGSRVRSGVWGETEGGLRKTAGAAAGSVLWWEGERPRLVEHEGRKELRVAIYSHVADII